MVLVSSSTQVLISSSTYWFTNVTINNTITNSFIMIVIRHIYMYDNDYHHLYNLYSICIVSVSYYEYSYYLHTT